MSAEPSAVPPPEPSPQPGDGPSAFATAMLAEVNALRRAGGRCGTMPVPPAPPLTWSDRLAQAAQRHAEDMRRHRHFDHVGSDGSTLAQRVEATGYHFQRIAENIAWGRREPAAVMRGWRDSPDHCQNIRRPELREMGAARAGSYWVLVLGSRG